MRAMVVLERVNRTEYADEVTFRPVCGKTPEENSYSKATPAGELKLTITNDALKGTFKPGQKFYVYFTEIVEPKP